MTQFNACISPRFDREREEKLCWGLIFMPLSVSVLACDASGGNLSLFLPQELKNFCTLLIRDSFALHVRVHDTMIKHFMSILKELTTNCFI